MNVLIPQYYAGSLRDPFNINKVTLFPNAIQDSVAVAGALAFAPHIRGIRLIIQARGGMNAFKGNRWLDWILNWYPHLLAIFQIQLVDPNRVDLECAGEISTGLTSNKQSTLITSEVEAQAINNRTLPLSQTFHGNDLSLNVEELALLYENWYSVARRRTDANAPALFDQSQLSRRLFADRSATGRQHKLIRLAILIQLNLLVWELQKSSSEKIKDSLESTIRTVSREETKSIGSTTHLL